MCACGSNKLTVTVAVTYIQVCVCVLFMSFLLYEAYQSAGAACRGLHPFPCGDYDIPVCVFVFCVYICIYIFMYVK